MGIYIFTLIILLTFSFLELRTSLTSIQHKSMLFFVFVLLVFQVGLRWHTGTDWQPYQDHYNEIRQFSDIFNSLTGFEKGYSFLVYVLKSLWNNYSFFLVVNAVFYYLLVFSAFKRLSPYVFVSILVFYTTSMGVMGSHRQLIALAICLFALRYATQRNAFKFFLLVFLAFMFHTSALIFIVYYFLYRKFNQVLIFCVLGISFILGQTNLPLVIFSYFGNLVGGMGSSKVNFYTEIFQENQNLNLTFLGLIKRLLFLFLFSYNYNYIVQRLNYYKLIYNGYIIGLIIYFLFSSSILILVNRGSLYFTAMEALLLSSQFIILKNKHYQVNYLLVVFIISVFFFFQSISGYVDLFIPYKGIFINSDFFRYRLQ